MLTNEQFEEVLFKITKVIEAAKLVVPTSEKCPLYAPLCELERYLDDIDAELFMKGYKNRK